MIGIGTIINVAGILCGGLLGLAFGKRLPERFQSILIQTASVCVLFLGIGGCMEKMLQITQDGLASSGSIMMILCFVLGSVVGELINIDQRLEQFGAWLKEKTSSGGDTSFVDAFATSSLTVCIGAMAVVGAVQDGIYGNYSILAAKAVLDLIIILVMTKGLHLLRHPCGGVPGAGHPAGRLCGTLFDRAGPGEPLPHRLDHDFLHRGQPDLEYEDSGGQHAPHPPLRRFMGFSPVVYIMNKRLAVYASLLLLKSILVQIERWSDSPPPDSSSARRQIPR